MACASCWSSPEECGSRPVWEVSGSHHRRRALMEELARTIQRGRGGSCGRRLLRTGHRHTVRSTREQGSPRANGRLHLHLADPRIGFHLPRWPHDRSTRCTALSDGHPRESRAGRSSTGRSRQRDEQRCAWSMTIGGGSSSRQLDRQQRGLGATPFGRSPPSESYVSMQS